MSKEFRPKLCYLLLILPHETASLSGFFLFSKTKKIGQKLPHTQSR